MAPSLPIKELPTMAMNENEDNRMQVKILELAAFYKGVVENNISSTMSALNKHIEFSTCVDKQGRNALMYALFAGANHVVKLFLENNLIPPMAEDNSGFTAFDWAVLGNNAVGCRLVEHWTTNNPGF